MRMKSAVWFYAGGKKKVSEDALYKDEHAAVMVAVDGVTRDLGEDGKYPDPSPAHLVAEAVARVIGRKLAEGSAQTERDIRQAMRCGNEAARIVNEELGLWQDYDYLGRDLAGCVVSAAVLRPGIMLWAYIGDCGAALLRQGEILWCTPDDVELVRPLFPKLPPTPTKEDRRARTVVVRRDFRNNPAAGHRTYGVLTGEEEALDYVRYGGWAMEDGDCAAVYTDGVTPLLRTDRVLRDALIRGEELTVQYRLDDRARALNLDDEKTIVFSCHR